MLTGKQLNGISGAEWRKHADILVKAIKAAVPEAEIDNDLDYGSTWSAICRRSLLS